MMRIRNSCSSRRAYPCLLKARKIIVPRTKASVSKRSLQENLKDLARSQSQIRAAAMSQGPRPSNLPSSTRSRTTALIRSLEIIRSRAITAMLKCKTHLAISRMAGIRMPLHLRREKIKPEGRVYSGQSALGV